MNVKFVVITANVGSLFENLGGIEDTWLEELSDVISSCQPHFIALHCQEVGGKEYKISLEPVKQFYRKLSCLKALKDFPVARGFVDGDVGEIDQYTALASFYFVHKSIKEAKLFNFKTEKFCDTSGKELFLHKLHQLPHVRKEKFAQSLAPDSKRSRKGYCRARWRINNKVIEFINVHLFHDESNLISMTSSPSPYTAYRKQALEYVLKKLREEFPTDANQHLIFGDFNFRLDVKALIQSLLPSGQAQDVRSETDKDQVIGVCFRENLSNGTTPEKHSEENNNKVLVQLERKTFKVEPSLFQPISTFEKLRQFDREIPALEVDLKEFDVHFPPTYPFSENTSDSDYMHTRCPSWCDRILVSKECWQLLQAQNSFKSIIYDTIGKKVCVGDHKPVYLSFSIATENEENETDSGGLRSFFESCTLF